MNQPPLKSPIHENSLITRPWANFINEVFSAVFAVKQSGTTAQRPTVGLWVGRPYFDTTLGQPIWYDGSDWIDATGATA